MEVLVVIVLISTVLLSAAAGMLVVLRSSSATENRQRAEMALSSAIEQMGRATYRTACPANYTAPTPAAVNLPDATVSIAGVRYWDGSSYQSPCDNKGAHLVTLRVAYRGVSVDGDAVIRNPERTS